MTTAECREPGSCPLLKQGKITQILNNEKSINMVKQKVVIGVFMHAESKTDICFVLTLLIHRFLATF